MLLILHVYMDRFSPERVWEFSIYLFICFKFLNIVYTLLLQIQNLKLNPNSSDSTSKPLVLGDMASGSEHFKEPFLVHIHSGKVCLFFWKMENSSRAQMPCHSVAKGFD